MGVALIPRGKTKKFCIIITPSGHFARLYQFLVRVPPSLPVFDTILVGTFYPIGAESACGKGFLGDFAELYGSDNASLYRRSGADCKSGCLRRFILPRLSISPNCVDTIWRNVFSRNRFGIYTYIYFCLISTPFLKVKTMLPSAFTVAFSTIAFHELGREIGDGRLGGFQCFQEVSHGAALYLAPVALCLYVFSLFSSPANLFVIP